MYTDMACFLLLGQQAMGYSAAEALDLRLLLYCALGDALLEFAHLTSAFGLRKAFPT